MSLPLADEQPPASHGRPRAARGREPVTRSIELHGHEIAYRTAGRHDPDRFVDVLADSSPPRARG